MIQKSLVKNTIYYLIYKLLNLIFPLFSGIYIARVLSPESIGQVSYAQNIVQYFIIFAFLGIPTYGIREVSNVRNEPVQLNRVFSELFIINFISTLFFLILYLALIFVNKSFFQLIYLYLIMSISLIFNIFNIDWLFEGLEEYGYISIRNTIFKFISILLLLTFVRGKDDYLIFAFINVLGIAGNNILNMIHSKKYISFIFEKLNLKRHVKSILFLVFVNLAIQIYSLTDVSMLGYFCSKNIVAYYVYGTRIYGILIQILTSVTMIIVPRMSILYLNKQYAEVNKLLSKALKIIILLSLPMIIGIFFTADDIIVLLYGQEYMKSGQILKILTILLIITPIGYLLGSRVLFITKNEKKMIIPVSIGAVVNVIGNYVLIQYYNGVGAAWSTVISQIVMTIVYIILSRKYFKILILRIEIIKIIIATIILVNYLFLVNNYFIAKNIKLIVELSTSPAIYFISLILLKEKFIYTNFCSFIKKWIIGVKNE